MPRINVDIAGRFGYDTKMDAAEAANRLFPEFENQLMKLKDKDPKAFCEMYLKLFSHIIPKDEERIKKLVQTNATSIIRKLRDTEDAMLLEDGTQGTPVRNGSPSLLTAEDARCIEEHD